ncbi:flagellar biosynthesis anti-sigma factor FlgM [Pacificimonas sp. WHA3]|uniref:Anti-sigma-28 factor n=1 Tax=Pacificimonas pallii TaxID=2827236 RepID=A0ABS6SF31_9SPHN|nr:flagellar biosynthesis anti-sigma factor FlgM [Pacificimonas pallii]MBV7257009.1 flagellar biosynthesis anti-sigma factor FlgM [Pacificimonas pallii]
MDKISTKITGATAATNVAANSKAPQQAATAVPAKGAASGLANAIELSALAVEAMRSDAPIDSAKIQQIRQAIAEGRYPMEPGEIAKAMIRMEFGDDAA